MSMAGTDIGIKLLPWVVTHCDVGLSLHSKIHLLYSEYTQMSDLVFYSFSTIPMCPFLIRRITCICMMHCHTCALSKVGWYSRTKHCYRRAHSCSPKLVHMVICINTSAIQSILGEREWPTITDSDKIHDSWCGNWYRWCVRGQALLESEAAQSLLWEFATCELEPTLRMFARSAKWRWTITHVQ